MLPNPAFFLMTIANLLFLILLQCSCTSASTMVAIPTILSAQSEASTFSSHNYQQRQQQQQPLRNYQQRNMSTLEKFRRSLTSQWIHSKASSSLFRQSKKNPSVSFLRGKGSKLFWTLPSKTDLYDLFSSSKNRHRQGMNQEFNHDCIGLTNPHQSVATNIVFTLKDYERSTSSSFASSSALESDTWWPPAEERDGWVLKRYRRRIGQGTDCYNAVRDKVIDWEFSYDKDDEKKEKEDNESTSKSFSSSQPMCGIFRVLPKSSSSSMIPENENPNVFQICKDPRMNICRKLVTFAKFEIPPLFPFLPPALRAKLPSLAFYAVNPVAVVYDLIDESIPHRRGGNGGGTFTSTAYATLKGHLLCGEERVTVLWRDDVEPLTNRVLPSSVGIPVSSSHSSFNMHPSNPSNKNSGWVDVEIVSYSKASPSWIGRIVWPFIGKKQDFFFSSELNALEDVARDCSVLFK